MNEKWQDNDTVNAMTHLRKLNNLGLVAVLFYQRRRNDMC